MEVVPKFCFQEICINEVRKLGSRGFDFIYPVNHSCKRGVKSIAVEILDTKSRVATCNARTTRRHRLSVMSDPGETKVMVNYIY